VREELPGCFVALGGPHAVAVPVETEAMGADLVVVGEADEMLADALTHRETGAVYGLSPLDLDGLPLPDWSNSYPAINSYIGNEPRFEHPEACVQWDRGCPHSCLFCSNPLYNGAKVRYGLTGNSDGALLHRRRSPRHVAQELTYLRDRWGIRHVFVYSDELIGAYPGQAEWLIDVCQEIAPIGLSWKTQGRCSKRLVTLEVLEAMREAGCKAVMWGCESGSQRVLKRLRKGTTPEDIWHTLSLAKQAGLRNWTFWMVGSPEETEEDLGETARFMRELKTAGLMDYKQVTVVTPVPGSPLYREAKEKGWLREGQGRYQYEPVMEMPWLTRQQIVSWRASLEAI
jgi:radical SAM superfamily enzyme YgiQ (UPF0313 family)